MCFAETQIENERKRGQSKYSALPRKKTKDEMTAAELNDYYERGGV